MREKKEINIKIGEQVKKARESAKLTQEQLAEKIEVSPQYISDLERGVVGISIQTLKTLCTELCVSSDSILFGSDDNKKAYRIQEKFEFLSDNQMMILFDIISKYVEAIISERENRK